LSERSIFGILKTHLDYQAILIPGGKKNPVVGGSRKGLAGRRDFNKK
jgi:hypothetical protein